MSDTNWVYLRSEPSLWTVGFSRPDGRWEADSDHSSNDAAARRVHWLNGGRAEMDEDQSPEITIRMDEEDFEQLSHDSMRWCGADGANDWVTQAGRFELHGGDHEINWQYTYVFWLGEEWASVLLARSYLEAAGQSCQILWDLAENPGPSWVILTDYVTALWLSMDNDG